MKLFHILVMALFITVVSCAKQDRENTIVNQEEAIDSYIGSLGEQTVVRNGGANRVVMKQGGGSVEAAPGDSLYIRYAGYVFSRGKGKLFVTNDTTVANQNNFPCEVSPEKIRLGDTHLVSGLEYGLTGVKEGEHCYIIFSAKYGYNNTVVYNIPKLSPLFYEVWVDKVFK